MRKLTFLFVAVAVLASCREDQLLPDDTSPGPDELDVALEEALLNASGGIGKEFYRFPASLSDIPQDPNNPLTAAKVELGRLLFHETGMGVNPKRESGRYTYSCASCHHASGGFQACLPQGIGEGGLGFGLHGEGRYPSSEYPTAELDVQPIRSPSALNIAYQTNILWNGQFGGTHLNEGTESEWHSNSPKTINFLGFEGVESQAIAGMDVHRLEMDEELFLGTEYRELYHAAFGQLPDDTLMSQYYAGLAIAAYERTLLATEAPFQKWLKGENAAMNPQQKRGATLFFGKAECASCHNGPALANMEFHALGMKDLEGAGVHLTNFVDQTVALGRGGFTGNAEDNYTFKVPQLYNLVQSRFYGHGASFNSVEAVIRYKNKAQAENPEVPMAALSPLFEPLALTDSEIRDLTAFIEHGLLDSELDRYVPNALPSGYCFPNNDSRSAADRGCD